MAASQTATQVRSLNEDPNTPWLPDACKWMAEALLDPSNPGLSPEVRDAFLKEYEQFCKDQGLEFDRHNRDKMASTMLQQVKIAASAPKALGALGMMDKGIWYRSSTQVKQNAWLYDNDMSKRGGKAGTMFKVGNLSHNPRVTRPLPSLLAVAKYLC